MKNKLKLAILCMSFCCVLALGIMGVLAVTQIDFVIGGNINFAADGVMANIVFDEANAATNITNLTGINTAEDLLDVTINTDKTKDQITGSQEYQSWSGLNLTITDATQVATIKFKIINTHSTDYLSASATVNATTAKNMTISVTPGNGLISPASEENTLDEQEFVITFTVTDPETNAIAHGFSIIFELKKAMVVEKTAFDSEYKYDLINNGKEIRIKEYLGDVIKLEIPAYVKSDDGTILSVVEIYEKSYGVAILTNCKNKIQEIIFPDTLRSISCSAFANCSQLLSISIPNPVEIGRDYAGSTSGAFDGCPNLLTTDDKGVEYLKNTINGVTNEYYALTNTIGVADDFDEKYIINSNCKVIGGYAFATNKVKRFEIPNSVEVISLAAFMMSSEAEELTLPTNLKFIGVWAFGGWENLRSVNFSEPNGWRVSTSTDVTSGTELTLTNSEQNATYLKDTYMNYCWLKK